MANSAFRLGTPVQPLSNNLILNGNFQVAQRGTTIAVAATTDVYTLDRWQISTNADQACTVIQYPGATSGSYQCIVQRNAGQTGTANCSFLTSLTRDMCVGAAGNYVTLSFEAAHGADYSAAADALVVRIVTGTGSVDESLLQGWTGAVNHSETITLTSGLVQYTKTINVPSDVTQLGVQFLCTPVGTAGADDSYTLKNVKLEIGENATQFVNVPLNELISQCQYFFSKSFNQGIAPAQNVGAGTGEENWQQVSANGAPANHQILFPVTMRDAPTMTFYNPYAANAQIYDWVQPGSWTNTAEQFTSQRSTSVSGNTVVGSPSTNTSAVHWTADAELY